MTMTGWIKIHRELLNKTIWKTSTTKQQSILITLLLMANFTQNEWKWKCKKYICKPGEFITSIDNIAKSANSRDISYQNVRTTLNKFVKFEFLTYESSKLRYEGIKVIISNWDVYQSNSNEQINNQLTINQQSTNNQLTTNKESKNYNNDNNDKNSLSLCIKKEEYEKEKKIHEIEQAKIQAALAATPVADTLKENKADPFCGTEIDKLIEMYKQHCPDLTQKKLYNKKERENIYEAITNYKFDWEYFKDIFIKANERKYIVNAELTLKIILNNLENIEKGLLLNNNYNNNNYNNNKIIKEFKKGTDGKPIGWVSPF